MNAHGRVHGEWLQAKGKQTQNLYLGTRSPGTSDCLQFHSGGMYPKASRKPRVRSSTSLKGLGAACALLETILASDSAKQKTLCKLTKVFLLVPSSLLRVQELNAVILELKTGTWRQDSKQTEPTLGTGGTLLPGLLPLACSTTFLI